MERAKRIGNKGDMDMNKTILTPADVRKLTGEDGTFFRIGFYKRPKPLTKTEIKSGLIQDKKGEYREMTCRFGVKTHLKGGKAAYDFNAKNLLGVWIPDQDRRPDGKDNGYRVVPCENVTVLKAHGNVWNVDGGVLIEATDA